MASNDFSAIQFADLEMAIEAVVSDFCFVDFGVVEEVPADGVVTVAINVARNDEDYRIFNCVYADLSTKSFCIRNKPQKGDKVVIVYPRRFSSGMFSLDKEDIIYDSESFSYHCAAGIALPFNQWQEKYENTVTFDEGKIDLNIGGDDSKFSVTVDEDGELRVKNPKGEFSIDKDGNIVAKNEKGSIELKSDGEINLKNNSNTVTMNSSSASVKINNHLEIN